ncbi:MAG: hypothetical protein LOD85_10570, partial [Clostridia bacterium]
AIAFAPGIIKVFVNDPDVIELGTRFLRVVGWSFGFAGGVMVVQGAFQGAGRTGASMVLAFLNHWLLRFPLAIGLIWGLGWGPAGLWWSMFLSSTASFAVAVAWLWRGGWHKAVIPSSQTPAPAGSPAAVPSSPAAQAISSQTASEQPPAQSEPPLAQSGSHGSTAR